MKIFVGLLIYMGLYRNAAVGEYWNKDGTSPTNNITSYMGQTRFEEIKRWFHISPPATFPRNGWYEKLQPLTGNLERRFQLYVLPASQVAVDEMMVRFTGRSQHTVRMPSKPIPEGYKIYALCDRGYTYAWAYSSRVDSFLGFDKPFPGPHPKGPDNPLVLSPTSRMFFWLCQSLPSKEHRFTVYCDNYFSNVPLFKALGIFGITCCGTARPNSAGYPAALKINKHQSELEWGTMAGEVVDDVLCIIWQDKSLVRFMTTAYNMKPSIETYTYRERRRPRIPKGRSHYRNMIESVWGENARQVLPLPTASVDYNLFMGGVDIADQRRSYLCNQLRVCRTWVPLFFWLLLTTSINSFLVAQQDQAQRGNSADKRFNDSRTFLRDLAWQLVQEGYNEDHAGDLNFQLTTIGSTPHQEPTRRALNGDFLLGNKPLGNSSQSRKQDK